MKEHELTSVYSSLQGSHAWVGGELVALDGEQLEAAAWSANARRPGWNGKFGAATESLGGQLQSLPSATLRLSAVFRHGW